MNARIRRKITKLAIQEFNGPESNWDNPELARLMFKPHRKIIWWRAKFFKRAKTAKKLFEKQLQILQKECYEFQQPCFFGESY